MPKHSKHHHHKDHKPNPSQLFTPKTEAQPRCDTQSVNVTVNVDQKDDGCTGCFKALVGAFKKG